jgi:signal peptidase II
MKKNINFYKIKNILIIYIIFIIDYYTKSFLISTLKINEKRKIFKFLNIRNTKNYGLIFGLFKKQMLYNNFFLYSINILFLISIFSIIYFCFKKKNSNNLSFTLLISGALGNFFDRLKYGYVIDFFDFHCYKYHFPIFNIADISIFFSLILFIIK